MTTEPTITGANDTVVVSPFSGAIFTLKSPEEVAWYERAVEHYEGWEWTDHSDLSNLDELLRLRLLSIRYGAWQSSGHDYDGTEVDVFKLGDRLDKMGKTIMDKENSLAVNRAKRKNDSAQTLHEYIQSLLERAEQYGVKRHTEYDLAFARFKDIVSVSETWLRPDQEERVKLGSPTAESVLQWIVDVAAKEIEAIDDEFVETHQMHWAKDL